MKGKGELKRLDDDFVRKLAQPNEVIQDGKLLKTTQWILFVLGFNRKGNAMASHRIYRMRWELYSL
jgi:hypothetical protein